MTSAVKPIINVLVFAGRNAQTKALLQTFPEGMRVLGIGHPSRELEGLTVCREGEKTLQYVATIDCSIAGWTAEDWAKVEVVYKCGEGEAIVPKAELQAIWPKLTNLKWVHSFYAGVDAIMIPEFKNTSVQITNARGAYIWPLAEWALAACNWFAKDLPRLQQQQKSKDWQPYYVEELRGKTLGIIGYGDIGQATAGIATAFKMKVVALRRRPALSTEDQLVKTYSPDEMNKLMAESDYVLAALPHTADTHLLINAEAIGNMKRSAVFINVGRGKCIDETALIAALQQGRIKGAALDVTWSEPLTQDSPLWDLDNVLLSPHCAVRTSDVHQQGHQVFCDLAKLYVAGQPLYNIVDIEAGY